MYLALRTRLGIAYAINKLAFTKTPPRVIHQDPTHEIGGCPIRPGGSIGILVSFTEYLVM